MRRTTMLWEVFVRRFEEAFEQYRRRRLTGEEAGELLGLSGRHFRRLCLRYEEDGVEGLRDRRIGKVSPHRAPERELERMHALYRDRWHRSRTDSEAYKEDKKRAMIPRREPFTGLRTRSMGCPECAWTKPLVALDRGTAYPAEGVQCSREGSSPKG